MKPNNFVLLRHKFTKLLSLIRKVHYKYLGMEIGENTILGKIQCSWPNKVSLGCNSFIEDNVVFKITRPFSEDNSLKIGENVFIGQGCEFNITLRMSIGNDCLIASNTTFVDAGRELNSNFNINKQPVIIKEITIEENVWIGTHCVILQGVTIGRGSVIGAGSVVNKPIPEYQIWAGCPARFIKNRN
ncbi:MAG: galactoside O-acetyltransferase [Mucilaginibacter sp.]|nr:galactoside O-acetyltransferase [Mucilaginibacter sp.]